MVEHTLACTLLSYSNLHRAQSSAPMAPVQVKTKHVRLEHFMDIPCSSTFGLLRPGVEVRVRVMVDGKRGSMLRSVLCVL